MFEFVRGGCFVVVYCWLWALVCVALIGLGSGFWCLALIGA